MTVEHFGVTELARAFGKVPIELRRELRPKLRAAVDVIVADMRGRAGYSSRIPGAIRVTSSFSGRRGGGGVSIRVDRKRAPHARALEGMDRKGRTASSFRHPVFGDRDVWVSQPTRPFFFPAVRAKRNDVRNRIAEAVRSSIKL